jgi:hypothetical protein
MMRRRGLLLTEQMRNRLAGCNALCGFAELLSLDDAANPPVKDLDDGCPRLEILGPH